MSQNLPVQHTVMVGKRPHYDMEHSDPHQTCKRPRRFNTPDSATSTVTIDQSSTLSPHFQHQYSPIHPATQSAYRVDTTPSAAYTQLHPTPPPPSPPPPPPPPLFSPLQNTLRSEAQVEADVHNSFATGDTGAIAWTNDMLITVLTTDIEDLCYVNEENNDHLIKPQHKIFFSQYRQPFELEFYIRRLVQYSNCSASAFVTALVYLDRVQERCKSLSMSEMNCHRLICTALVLAIKYLDDEVYSNVYYARVGGLSTEELNSLESTMLDVLGWNLTVCPETYGMYEDSLMQSASLLNMGSDGASAE